MNAGSPVMINIDTFLLASLWSQKQGTRTAPLYMFVPICEGLAFVCNGTVMSLSGITSVITVPPSPVSCLHPRHNHRDANKYVSYDEWRRLMRSCAPAKTQVSDLDSDHGTKPVPKALCRCCADLLDTTEMRARIVSKKKKNAEAIWAQKSHVEPLRPLQKPL